MNSRFPGQRRALDLGFLLMGFSLTVTQSLLIRELLVAFFGNELSIGLVLGNWLLLEAAGSGCLGRWAGRRQGGASSFATCQVLFALLLPLCLCAAGVSRRLVGAAPGQGLGLIPIFGLSFLILAPLALVGGAMFVLGCRACAPLTANESHSIGRVYVLEAWGGVAGGVVFTYLFIPLLQSFQTVFILAGLNLLAAILILVESGPRQGERPPHGLGLAVVLLIADVGVLLSPLAQEIQQWAASQPWPGYRLLYSENSAYGNVAVVERADQYTFLADGIPILNAPVPDVARSEEIVHLPMLFVAEPRRALVLSGGLGGVLHELTKYPLKEIDYAELDPLLIEAVRRFPTPLTADELDDPRLTIELVDGRLLVRRQQAGAAAYDLVIVNLPYPSTLQLNRFYTVEFFQMVRQLLAEDGVVVVVMPGSLSYLSDELRRLNAMTCLTLREVFPHLRPVPGDMTLWLASPSADLAAAGVASLLETWQARGLETQLVTAPHIRLRLDERVLDWFWTSLGGEEGGTELNRDLRPVGLFYGLSYWNSLFSPVLARMFEAAGRLNLWLVGLPLLGCALLLWAVVSRTGKGQGAIVPIAIATTGFAGMAAELVIILAFQSLYGYVYHWIGLLVAAFMAGLALGGQIMNLRLTDIRSEWPALVWLELALVLFGGCVPLLLNGLYAHAAHPAVFALVQVALLALNGVAGFLVGAQFPLANQLWLKGRGAWPGREGVLYASDLIGAFIGSILVSVFLIPVLGILQTCFLVAILKLSSLLLVTRLRQTTAR